MASPTDDCRVHSDFIEMEFERMAAPRRKQLEAHLAGCPRCRARRDEAMSFKDLVQDMGGKPRRKPTVVSRTVEPAKPSRFPRARLWRWAKVAGALAALALVCAPVYLHTPRVLTRIGAPRATPAWTRHRLSIPRGAGLTLTTSRSLPAQDIGDSGIVLATPVPGGDFITLSNHGRLRRWDPDHRIRSSRELFPKPSSSWQRNTDCAVLDADERGLFVGSSQGLHHVPLDEKLPMRLIDSQRCTGLAWTANHATLISCHEQSVGFTVKTRRGEEIVQERPAGRGTGDRLQATSDGRYVVVNGYGILDLSTGKIATLPSGDRWEDDCTLEPETARLIRSRKPSEHDYSACILECFRADRTTSPVWSLTLPPNVARISAAGGLVYCCTWDHTSGAVLHTLDVQTGREIRQVPLTCGHGRARATFREGTLIRHLSRGWDAVCQNDVITGKCRMAGGVHRGPIRKLRASGDGSRLAYTAGGGPIHLLRVDGSEDRRTQASFARAMAFSQDGSALLIVDADSAGWLQLDGSMALVPFLKCAQLSGAEVVDEGRAVIASRSGRVDRIDLTGGTSRDASLQMPFLRPETLELSTDATGSTGLGQDRAYTPHPWSLKARVTLVGLTRSMHQSYTPWRISPDGKHLAYGASSGLAVARWPQIDGDKMLSNQDCCGVEFLDDEIVAATTLTGQISVFDIDAPGKPLCSYQLPEAAGIAQSITLSASGSRFWVGTTLGGLYELTIGTQ